MSFPRGQRRGEVAMLKEAPRQVKYIDGARGGRETLWVDPLFIALSVVTGGGAG